MQNPKGTLPALQVDGQAFTDTQSVTHWLVKNAPKKVAAGTSFIGKLHEDKYDPNFPLLLVVSVLSLSWDHLELIWAMAISATRMN